MKILNVIHAQSIGGVDQVFRYYNQTLINNNEVAIVISDNGNDDYHLPGLKKIYKLKNFTPALDVLHMLKIIRQFKPDIIICHSARSMKWMSILRPLIKAKTIAVNHSIYYKKSLHCEYVFSINDQIKNMVIKDGKDPKKSIFMPNMIEIDQNCKFLEDKKFHEIPVIGMFGRIEPRKGFDILFRAAKILKDRNIEFKLMIGGFVVPGVFNEDNLKKVINELGLADKTEFVGIVRDKKSFFDKIDIFCVPSREEPFGMVIIESFLHSTPVISSDCDGAKMIIENNHDALIFPIEDHQVLAEKIILLINNQILAKTISRNAFSKVKEKYSIEVVGNVLQKELERILTA